MYASTIFSSVEGRIKILLMAAPDPGDRDQTGRISAVLNVLPADAGLLVWCNFAADRDALQSWLQTAHGDIEILKSDAGSPLPADFRCLVISPAREKENYSHWVRDPLLFCWGNGKSVGILKSRGAKLEDQSWPEKYFGKIKIGNLAFTVNKQTFLPVAGGNFLCHHNTVFVGHHQFAAFSADAGIPAAQEQLLNALNERGRFTRVIRIGETAAREPTRLPHIDLYLTLTGIRRGWRKKYVVLLGECVAVHKDRAPDADVDNIAAGINRYLNAVEKQLVDEGFEPLRIPLPLIASDALHNAGLCSYNNCLVQRSDSGNTVWLPRYTYDREPEPWYGALKTAEEAVTKTWESLGYSVRFVDANFHSILDEYGSLHCITQEIRRV